MPVVELECNHEEMEPVVVFAVYIDGQGTSTEIMIFEGILQSPRGWQKLDIS